VSRWRGAGLVAGRELRERVRTRTFRITTLVLVLAALAGVIVPALVGDEGPPRSTVAVAGGPASLPETLRAAGAAQDRTVDVRRVGAAEAERQAASGDVDAAVIAGQTGPVRVLVEDELSDDLRGIIAQAIAGARVSDALARSGLPPREVAQVVAPPDLEVEPRGERADVDGGDLAVGFIVSLVLYLALLFSGIIVATGVAEEKSTRVSEVLLASLRPSELLLGKVAGIGLVSLGQLAAVAAPALSAALALDAVDVPAATTATILWGLVWFLAGYALYGAAYGALGALVGRQQEVGQATAPLALLLVCGYLASNFSAGDLESWWVRPLSLLPPFAPMMMPMRIAGDAVSTGEVLAALALTLASAAVLIALGARVYRTGITRTGPRIRLREALFSPPRRPRPLT
jgi:ABC-2 type transport system permease protein